MNCDIIINIVGLERLNKNSTPYHKIMDYACTAGVSSLSSRIEKCDSNIINHLDSKESGWSVQKEFNPRKVVKIELPDGVYYGKYAFSNVFFDGIYSEYSANDGMGKSVFAYCGKCPVAPTTEDHEKVIDDTINSGIFLSIPQKDGSRKEIEANVIAISECYTWTLHDWTWENPRVMTLREARKAMSITQQRLADISGVCIRQIQKVESGESKIENLTAKNAISIANALHIDVKDLIDSTL